MDRLRSGALLRAGNILESPGKAVCMVQGQQQQSLSYANCVARRTGRLGSVSVWSGVGGLCVRKELWPSPQLHIEFMGHWRPVLERMGLLYPRSLLPHCPERLRNRLSSRRLLETTSHRPSLGTSYQDQHMGNTMAPQGPRETSQGIAASQNPNGFRFPVKVSLSWTAPAPIPIWLKASLEAR